MKLAADRFFDSCRMHSIVFGQNGQCISRLKSIAQNTCRHGRANEHRSTKGNLRIHDDGLNCFLVAMPAREWIEPNGSVSRAIFDPPEAGADEFACRDLPAS